MSDSEEQNRRDEPDIQELLRWLIRYVLMPLTLAVLAGYFAVKVTELATDESTKPTAESESSEILTVIVTLIVPTNEPIPEPTATLEPTPEEDAEEEDAAASEEFKPAPPTSPPCGPVPFGWQRYTVQPGDTLFSLAQSRGTTIGAIRQANCLYGQLIAYQQIWLPSIIDVRPVEPPVEVTVVVDEPSEPITLPDLINFAEPEISTSCIDGPGTCSTTVIFMVTNSGDGAAGAFDVLVRIDPDQSVVMSQPISGLQAGETGLYSLTSPPGDLCFDPDCNVCITVDSRNTVAEENETNNELCAAFAG